MLSKSSCTALVAFALVVFSAPQAPAVNVIIDYTYDTTAFFGSGNPDGALAGAQARASLDAVADYFSTILDDSLSSIQTPGTYVSSAPGGQDVFYSWSWDQIFDHPTTQVEISISNPTIPANEYRIYAGARQIAGTTLGIGGPGAYASSAGGSYYFQWQLDEIQSISADFSSQLETRGEPAGEFGRWGGTITFDTDSNWNYDISSEPANNENDFLSVAYHEIAHALGFGTSDEWNALVNGGVFFGAEARQANGGAYPAVTGGHWQEDLQSTIFGTSTLQEVALDPTITRGDRKLITTLDAAGLADIGWTVIEPTPPTVDGDYNDDQSVDAVDYAIWRESLGTGNVIGSFAKWRDNYGASSTAGALVTPEPASALLLLPLLLATVRRR